MAGGHPVALPLLLLSAALLLLAGGLPAATACGYFGYAGVNYLDCIESTAYLISENLLDGTSTDVTGYMDIDWAETKLCWTFVLGDTSNVTAPGALEVYRGDADEDGPLLFTIFDTLDGDPLKRPNAAKAQYLVKNNAAGGCYYGNVTMQLTSEVVNAPASFYMVYRTAAHPNGAARGQLLAEKKFFANLEVANVVPPPDRSVGVASDGYAELEYSEGRVCWTIILDTGLLSGVTGAHIHAGALGVAGDADIIVTLFDDVPVMSGCTVDTVPLANYYKMRAQSDSFYLDIHTADYPITSAGMTRGQLEPKITIINRLSASVTFSMTLGNGGIDFSLSGWTSALGTAYELQHIQPGLAPALRFPMMALPVSTAPSYSGWATVHDQDYVSYVATYPTLYYAYVHATENLTKPIGMCPSCYLRIHSTCVLCAGDTTSGAAEAQSAAFASAPLTFSAAATAAVPSLSPPSVSPSA
eukprot:SM000192S04920  [mRNA]  locus=s192:121235:124642:- [translate_table: standard]